MTQTYVCTNVECGWSGTVDELVGDDECPDCGAKVELEGDQDE